MLTIDIPVCDRLIAVDVYVNVDVQLLPKCPTRTPREGITLQQVQTRLNAEIYTAVKRALEELSNPKG